MCKISSFFKNHLKLTVLSFFLLKKVNFNILHFTVTRRNQLQPGLAYDKKMEVKKCGFPEQLFQYHVYITIEMTRMLNFPFFKHVWQT